MTPEQADEIMRRGLPINQSWRSVNPRNRNDQELHASIKDTEEAERNAKANFDDPTADREDREYAYESMVRARLSLKELREIKNLRAIARNDC